MSFPPARRDIGANSRISFASITAALGWVARLGASGAEENARRAVAAAAHSDALVAELDERAQRNGWAHRVYLGVAIDADGRDACFDEAGEDSVARSA